MCETLKHLKKYTYIYLQINYNPIVENTKANENIWSEETKYIYKR